MVIGENDAAIASDGVSPSKPRLPAAATEALGATIAKLSMLSSFCLKSAVPTTRDALRHHRRLAGVRRRQDGAGRLEAEIVAPVGGVAVRRDGAGDDAARLAEEERRRLDDQRLFGDVPVRLEGRLVEQNRIALLDQRMTPAPRSRRALASARRRPCRNGCWRGRKAGCRRTPDCRGCRGPAARRRRSIARTPPRGRGRRSRRRSPGRWSPSSGRRSRRWRS